MTRQLLRRCQATAACLGLGEVILILKRDTSGKGNPVNEPRISVAELRPRFTLCRRVSVNPRSIWGCLTMKRVVCCLVFAVTHRRRVQIGQPCINLTTGGVFGSMLALKASSCLVSWQLRDQGRYPNEVLTPKFRQPHNVSAASLKMLVVVTWSSLQVFRDRRRQPFGGLGEDLPDTFRARVLRLYMSAET